MTALTNTQTDRHILSHACTHVNMRQTFLCCAVCSLYFSSVLKPRSHMSQKKALFFAISRLFTFLLFVCTTFHNSVTAVMSSYVVTQVKLLTHNFCCSTAFNEQLLQLTSMFSYFSTSPSTFLAHFQFNLFYTSNIQNVPCFQFDPLMVVQGVKNPPISKKMLLIPHFLSDFTFVGFVDYTSTTFKPSSRMYLVFV